MLSSKMGEQPHPFGTFLRAKRTAKQYSLRRFAQLVEVSPTYISQVEQGTVPPPTVERIRRMASLLGEDPDHLIALAGRTPDDISKEINDKPQEMATFLREASGLTAEQLQSMIQHLRAIKKTRSVQDGPPDQRSST